MIDSGERGPHGPEQLRAFIESNYRKADYSEHGEFPYYVDGDELYSFVNPTVKTLQDIEGLLGGKDTEIGLLGPGYILKVNYQFPSVEKTNMAQYSSYMVITNVDEDSETGLSLHGIDLNAVLGHHKDRSYVRKFLGLPSKIITTPVSAGTGGIVSTGHRYVSIEVPEGNRDRVETEDGAVTYMELYVPNEVNKEWLRLDGEMVDAVTAITKTKRGGIFSPRYDKDTVEQNLPKIKTNMAELRTLLTGNTMLEETQRSLLQLGIDLDKFEGGA